MTGMIIFIFACCCFFFFQLLYPYHLYFREQTQLFIFTPDYFISYFDKPAWLACYLGDFITQFFYLRGGGAVSVTLIFILEWWLIRYILRIFFEKSSMLALFPIVIECIFYFELYYNVAVSVAFIIVLFSFLLFSLIKNGKLSYFAAFLFVPVLYFLAGALSFIFPFLVIFSDIRNGKIRLVYWLLLAALTGLFPLCMQSVYLLTIKQAYLFPLASVLHISAGSCLIIIILCMQIKLFRRITISSVKSVIILFLLLTTLLIAGLRQTADFDREKILALSVETYFDNPEEVIRLSDKYKLSFAKATYYTNLALSQTGTMPEKLFDYYQPASIGLFLPVNSKSDWMSIFFSNEVFFHLGDMNMAQHSAMLGQIFSPRHRSSRMVKRLAEINMISGDTAVARKYLRMLDATLFHRKWAASYGKTLDGEDTERFQQIKEMQTKTIIFDTLRMSSDYVSSLKLLTESNPDNINAVNYLMCYYLLNKDIKSFYSAYEKYGKQNTTFQSVLYMQALLIKLFIENVPQQQLQSFGIPNDIITDFMDYTQLFEQSAGNMDMLREKYGSTYWFYFHFAQMKER